MTTLVNLITGVDMKKILPFILVFSMACSGGGTESQSTDEEETNAEVEALYDEVIAVHDSVMPRMQEIVELKSLLEARLVMIQDQEPDTETGEIESTIGLLDSADNGMMNWMREFEPITDDMDQEQILSYLKKEKRKIIGVRDLMLEAIEQGNMVAGDTVDN